jgi:hypothetical protein
MTECKKCSKNVILKFNHFDFYWKFEIGYWKLFIYQL